MKLKFIGTGNPITSKLIHADTGELVENVTRVEVTVDAQTGESGFKVYFRGGLVDFEVDLNEESGQAFSIAEFRAKEV